MTSSAPASCTVAEYLAVRLREIGIGHVFTIPGDYCAPFIDALDATPGIERVANINELGCGYAADGYARLKGVGAACVQYGVGTFSLLNCVAGSFVEFVPVGALVKARPELGDRDPGGRVHDVGGEVGERPEHERAAHEVRLRLDGLRRSEMLKELQDATVALSKIRYKLQSTGEKLQYTVLAKSQLARGLGNQPAITVMRNATNGLEKLAANEDSELQPGDVVEVALMKDTMGPKLADQEN